MNERYDTETATDSVDNSAAYDIWYEKLEGIDGAEALKNSGSEDVLRSVMEVFLRTVEEKASELDGFLEAEDWENYTIKIHALKSSARLIGALTLSDKALKLEMAGKDGDTDYIRSNHEAAMSEFRKYIDILAPVFADSGSGDVRDDTDKPAADKAYINSFYEKVMEAAESMDCDIIEEALDDIAEYALPSEVQKKVEAIRDKNDMFDYKGIVDIVKE